MFHRLLSALCVLSLLASAAICTLWVRSERQCDEFGWHDVASGYDEGTVMGAANGHFYVRCDSPAQSDVQRIRRKFWRSHPDAFGVDCHCRQIANTPVSHRWHGMGLIIAWGLVHPNYEDNLIRRAIVAPFWMPFAATLPLPFAWLSVTLLRRRVRPGCCLGCGYNLRATPNRCPECGMSPVTMK